MAGSFVTHNEKTKMDTGGGNSPSVLPRPRSVLLRSRDDQTRAGARPALLRGTDRAGRKGCGEMKKQTIQDVAGCVTVHVELDPRLMRWAAKQARIEGHNDIQIVLRKAVDLLKERHEAGLLGT